MRRFWHSAPRGLILCGQCHVSPISLSSSSENAKACSIKKRRRPGRLVQLGVQPREDALGLREIPGLFDHLLFRPGS